MTTKNEFCPKCYEIHEWFNLYVEKNAKLQLVKNMQIAWCDSYEDYVTKDVCKSNHISTQSFSKN